MNFFVTSIVILSGVLFFRPLYAYPDFSKSLMSAFGSGCYSSGGLTSRELENSKLIRGIIKEVQADEECKVWVGNINSLLASGQLYQAPYSYNQSDKIADQISRLEEALLIESNPVIRERLIEELAKLKVDFIYEGDFEDEKLWARRIESIDSFSLYLDTLNSTLFSDVSCLERYPQLAMRIGGELIKTSEQTNIWGLAAGAGLMGVGSVTSTIVTGIRGNRFKKELKKLSISTLTESLLCSIEKVSSNFCRAKEVKEKIGYISESDISIHNKNWLGLKLIKSLKIFNKWTELLIAGTPSNDSAYAERKNEILKLQSELMQAKEMIHAKLSEAIKMEREIIDEDQRINYRTQVVNSLLKFIIPKSGKDLFYNFFGRDLSCGPKSFFFTGIKVPKFNTFERCDNFIIRIKGDLIPPPISEIKKKVVELLDETEDFINIKSRMFREVDPELIYFKADEMERRLFSPIDLMTQTISYLEKIEREYHGDLRPSLNYLIQSTKNILVKSLEIYSRPLEGETSSSLNYREFIKEKLENMRKLLAPEMKVTYIGDRLKRIVNYEINKKVLNNQFDKVLEDFILLSMSDSADVLERLGGIDLQRIDYDARGAMRTSFDNMEILTSLFKPRIRRVIEELDRKIKRHGDVDAFRETLNNYCIALLSVPNLKKFSEPLFGRGVRLRKYCNNAKLESIYSNAKISVHFNDMEYKDYYERGCAYYNFIKRNKIYRLYRINKSHEDH
jgi:hypothetical protein